GVRLIAADPRLELEMADGRVENGLRRERRAGVVQVHDVLAARRVGAGALDVDSVRSLAALHLGLILPNYGEALTTKRLAAAAVAAEHAGFDSGWVTDHLLVPPEHAPVYGTIAEALVSLGFLAARTQRLELGVSALVVPQRNPLVALRQLATLDLLS